MAGVMNISGMKEVEDPSYRYKMPCMVTKIEGRGNGIKTILVNIVDVATSLNRDPPEVTKFFGCELGAQTSYGAEEAGVPKAIVNGAQTTAVMQNLLKTYIEKFVLCKQCHLPEAHYKVKAGVISHSCKACGAKEIIDMSHKLCSFILKAHATRKDEKKKAEKDAEGKKDKKEKKEKKDKKDKEEGEESPTKMEKEKKPKKDKKEKEKADLPSSSTSSSSNPPVPPSDIEDVSDKAALEDAITQFRLWVDAAGTSELSAATTAEKVRSLATMSSLRTADRYIILLSGVFTEEAVTKNEVEKHADIFRQMLTNEIQQRQLIAAFEWLCGARFPALGRYFPVLLKQLFDEDLVAEDVFFQWNLDMTPNDYSVAADIAPVSTLEQLKKNAAQFITWLEEAEEEEDDEEEEDN